MANENNAATDPVDDSGAAANQTPPADTGASENPPAGGSRTYSQEEHDKIVKAV